MARRIHRALIAAAMIVSAGPAGTAAAQSGRATAPSAAPSVKTYVPPRTKYRVPATNAFPGECTGLGGNALRDCVDALVECQVCLMLSDMDNMFVNCDLFDDGLSNGSCFSPD